MLNSENETYNSKMCRNEASEFFKWPFAQKECRILHIQAAIYFIGYQALNKYNAY